MKRYNIDREGYCHRDDDRGDWVEADDAIGLLAQKDKEIAELKKVLTLALAIAKSEYHPYRSWHGDAENLLAKYENKVE